MFWYGNNWKLSQTWSFSEYIYTYLKAYIQSRLILWDLLIAYIPDANNAISYWLVSVCDLVTPFIVVLENATFQTFHDYYYLIKKAVRYKEKIQFLNKIKTMWKRNKVQQSYCTPRVHFITSLIIINLFNASNKLNVTILQQKLQRYNIFLSVRFYSVKANFFGGGKIAKYF